MKISDLLRSGRTFSFEFFPPKTDHGDRQLRATLTALEPLQPSFVSVTYGAGGTTRERTHRIVVDLLRRTTMTPMAHLTSVGHTRGELRDILRRYVSAGVVNVLALRGDPPAGSQWTGELHHAIELVDLARQIGGHLASIGVAAHPEGHPLATSLAEDRRQLAAKLQAADFGVTQFFFRAVDYLRMVDDLDRLGCDRPVLPGIMPITNLKQIQRFAQLSGSAVPAEVLRHFDRCDPEDTDEVARIGAELATALSHELLERGAPGLHFYTLNRSSATRAIYHKLGLSKAA